MTITQDRPRGISNFAMLHIGHTHQFNRGCAGFTRHPNFGHVDTELSDAMSQ
jgi:hypothetical protein